MSEFTGEVPVSVTTAVKTEVAPPVTPSALTTPELPAPTTVEAAVAVPANTSASNSSPESNTPPGQSVPEVKTENKNPSEIKSPASKPNSSPVESGKQLPPEKPTPPEIDAKKNFYERLGLTPNATNEEIRDAFRNLSKEYHPDKNPHGEESFKLINEAYTNIKNEALREKYAKFASDSEKVSDSDFSAATIAARTVINVVGMDKIGRYVNSKIKTKGQESVSPQQIAELLPEVVDPIASALANPNGENISFVIPLTPEERRVLLTLDDILKNSRDKEAALKMQTIMQVLIALILAMQVIQKAIAKEDWSEDFSDMIKESSVGGQYARYLRLNLDYQNHLRDQKETADHLSVPALPEASPQRPVETPTAIPNVETPSNTPIQTEAPPPTPTPEVAKPPDSTPPTNQEAASAPSQTPENAPALENIAPVPQLPPSIEAQGESDLTPLQAEFVGHAQKEPEAKPDTTQQEETISPAEIAPLPQPNAQQETPPPQEPVSAPEPVTPPQSTDVENQNESDLTPLQNAFVAAASAPQTVSVPVPTPTPS